MRILAVIVVAFCAFLTVGCNGPEGVELQPPVQGDWSNFHNDKNQISPDVRQEAAKPPADK